MNLLRFSKDKIHFRKSKNTFLPYNTAQPQRIRARSAAARGTAGSGGCARGWPAARDLGDPSAASARVGACVRRLGSSEPHVIRGD
jgi:hypothetical protein